MHGVHSTNSNLSPALITAVRRVLRPFIKLMLAKGITYPFLTEMLKDLYVEVAANDFKIGDKPSTDSHLSLLTGIHRKDIKRLRHGSYADTETTPQAVSLMLARHRKAIRSLRGALELKNLSARAVNALGRHGIRTREQARQKDVLALLNGERNCGRKTLGEIAQWIEGEHGRS